MKELLQRSLNLASLRGATYADVRVVGTARESLRVLSGRVSHAIQGESSGFGVRVIVDGAWGFASSAICTQGEMRKVANRALQIARASALTRRAEVRLAEADPFVDRYETPVVTDPFEVRLARKLDLLLGINKILAKGAKIRVAESSMDFFRTEKMFVSTEGADIEQVLTESGAGYTATAVESGEVQRRSYPNSHRGDFGTGGYELIERMNMLDHAERVREEALALLTAPVCPSGPRTIIIDASQMALQVHESCGHPTELDRVLGTEISLAGGSFLTLEKRNKLRLAPRSSISSPMPPALAAWDHLAMMMKVSKRSGLTWCAKGCLSDTSLHVRRLRSSVRNRMGRCVPTAGIVCR